MSADSPPQMILRTKKVIVQRKPIHKRSPRPDDRSPNRKNCIYPDVQETFQKEELSENEETQSENKEKKSANEETQSENEEDQSLRCSSRCKTEETQKTNFSWLLVVLAMLLVIISLMYKSGIKQSSMTEIDCSEFLMLGKKFPNQDIKLFKSLNVSIEGTYKRTPKRPAVFCFFSTDQNILDNLITDVVKIAKDCTKQKNDPIILTNSILNKQHFIDDYTKIISEYKQELIKKEIMIIKNLDSLSLSILPSLHSFADVYNPLVQKSILFFTILVPIPPASDEKPVDFIHNHLHDKWRSMKDNIRGPLITRILDQAFYIDSSF